MKWVEIEIVTTEEASDAICEMLSQLGADGIAVCDPLEIKRIIDDPDSLAYADDGFVDSLGTDVTIHGYFAEFDDGIRLGAKEEEYENPEGVGTIYGNIATGSKTLEETIALLEERLAAISEFLPVGNGKVGYKYVKDEDWENEWKKDYHAFSVSENVIIAPSWERDTVSDASEEGKKVVYLDPGSAFGTGTHETTSMCAELIDEHLTTSDTVLDVGCGSGILSIIAAKLGAKEVEACDIDRMAVDVAITNCKENGVEVDCYTGELKDAKKEGYSLIIANIVAEIIAGIAPMIPEKLLPGGHFIASGIIDHKKEIALSACEAAGLRLLEEKQKGDWHAYYFEKK
ncbi:MAG: 50S ribosomal protein L11 methyltransferase [Clostridiales bacterium]|nr:50S ribosomal protein L11 methyltransferase [Clostridiales bacterium]